MRTLFEICESILTSNGIGLPKCIHGVTKLKGWKHFEGRGLYDWDMKVTTTSKNWIRLEFESEGSEYTAYWAEDSNWILYYTSDDKKNFFKNGRYWAAWDPCVKFTLKDFNKFNYMLTHEGATVTEMIDIETDLE